MEKNSTVVKKYTIGKREFVQEKLAWRQIRLVLAQFSGLTFVEGSVASILQSIGGRMATVAGILLRPAKDSRDAHMARLKSPEAFEQHIEFFEDALELDQAAEVIDDFLDLNRISYVLNLFQGIGEKITKAQAVAPKNAPTPSNESAPSSPAATLPTVTVS